MEGEERSDGEFSRVTLDSRASLSAPELQLVRDQQRWEPRTVVHVDLQVGGVEIAAREEVGRIQLVMAS